MGDNSTTLSSPPQKGFTVCYDEKNLGQTYKNKLLLHFLSYQADG